MLKIHNVRFGFATNSSSSHSVVLAPGMVDNLSMHHPFGFGWERFVLASPSAKSNYMLVAAKEHYKRYLKVSDEEAVAVARAFFPCADDDLKAAVEGYIDHQSDPGFPIPRLSEQGMGPLWRLMQEEIVNDDAVVILGGNDNEDWDEPIKTDSPDLALYYDVVREEEGSRTTRRFLWDKEFGHFVVFDYATGSKTRLTGRKAAKPTVASTPELVDVKITDFCPVGCSYCYQGSTKRGRHADTDKLMAWIDDCGREGVFEAAIGGGDPTTHPDFAEILERFHKNGIVPNFSTQLWDWLDDQKIANAVMSYCGAVALSTQSPADAKRWIEECSKRKMRGHVHYVLGLSPLSNLVDMLEVMDGSHLVLLAYKQMGRAQNKPPIDYTGWQHIVRKHRPANCKVAVDSFLVQDVEDGFSRKEVPGVLFEQGDGRFSLYYDAVEQEYAAHSFVPRGEQRVSHASMSYPSLLSAWRKVANIGSKRWDD